MSEAKPARYQVKYDNDVGPNDDYFDEFYNVLDNGEVIAECRHAADANKIVEALNHIENHKKPRPGLRDNY